MKIDFATIKTAFYAWKFSKMECLKLAHNGFNLDEYTAMK